MKNADVKRFSSIFGPYITILLHKQIFNRTKGIKQLIDSNDGFNAGLFHLFKYYNKHKRPSW